jgi:hypothetical protein
VIEDRIRCAYYSTQTLSDTSVPVKETQGDKPKKKEPKKVGTGGDPPEDPSSSSDDSGSDTSGSKASAKSKGRRTPRKPKREDYLSKYLQAKQHHFGAGNKSVYGNIWLKRLNSKGKSSETSM